MIAGVIGRCVKKLSHGKYEIPRITGIDPGMIPLNLITELNSNDATFVDTIHGESSFFGSPTALGHASFWINNGQKFPECKANNFLLDAVCSHLSTPMVFAATVRRNNPREFLAARCGNYFEYKQNLCTQKTPLGLYADPSSRGKFYLDKK